MAGAVLLLRTSLPIAVMAITRHAPSPPSAHGASRQEPVQLIIDCRILKPGLTFSETNLQVFAETQSTSLAKQTEPKFHQAFIYSFPDDSVKQAAR